MFGEQSYELHGPYGKEMKFSADLTEPPTLNLVPEIVAAPDFKGKEIQLTLEDGDTRFKIGEDYRLSLVCTTGDPEKNEFVFALKNSSFEKPVLATLVYTEEGGVTAQGVEFELEEWVGEFGYAGWISVPSDAAPWPAELFVNFSGMDEEGRGSAHFPQVIGPGKTYVNQAGEKVVAFGWAMEVELVR
jgi:hypothetical protein